MESFKNAALLIILILMGIVEIISNPVPLICEDFCAPYSQGMLIKIEECGPMLQLSLSIGIFRPELAVTLASSWASGLYRIRPENSFAEET